MHELEAQKSAQQNLSGQLDQVASDLERALEDSIQKFRAHLADQLLEEDSIYNGLGISTDEFTQDMALFRQSVDTALRQSLGALVDLAGTDSVSAWPSEVKELSRLCVELYGAVAICFEACVQEVCQGKDAALATYYSACRTVNELEGDHYQFEEFLSDAMREPLANRIYRTLTPEFVYVKLEARYATMAVTAPDQNYSFGVNPVTEIDGSECFVMIYKNNGTYRFKGDVIIDMADEKTIEPYGVSWMGESLSFEQFFENQSRYIEQLFPEIHDSISLPQMNAACEQMMGISKGMYLYRAITSREFKCLSKNPLVPTFYAMGRTKHAGGTNFEVESVFRGENSQVKGFVPKTDDGYSGHIVRFKVEHPWMYLAAGMSLPRIEAHLPHYLPLGIEISDDGGETFVDAKEYLAKQ